MASLPDLVTRLRADTSNFQKGMSGAQTTMVKASAAIVAAGAAAAVASIKMLADTGDMFHKMSLRTGIASEELSRFQFAAEQSGSGLATVEKGLKTMSVLMLNADRGLSTATDTMGELGITSEQLAGQSQTQRFQIFAESIAAIEDPARQTAMAVQVFGRAGAELLPLIKEGAAGFARLAAESDNLGNTVSTTESLIGAELTDAMNRAWVAAKGGVRAVAMELAPAFLALEEVVTPIVSQFRFMAPVLVPIATGIGLVAAAVLVSVAAWWAYQLAARAAALAQVKVLALMGPAGWTILAGAPVALGLATAGLIAMTNATDESVAKQKELHQEQDAIRKQQGLIAESIEGTTAAHIDDTNAIKNRTLAAEDLASALRGLETPQETLNREVEEFQAILAATNQGIVWDDHPLVKAMRQKKSGFSDTMKTIQDDLRVLRGEATETAIELERMLEGIAPQDQPEIAAAFAERQRLEQQQEAAAFWKSKQDDTAKSAEQEAKRRQQQIAQNNRQLLPSQQRGSTEALTTILRSMGGSGKSEEAKATEKVEKATNRQSEILQAGFDAITREKEEETVQGAVT